MPKKPKLSKSMTEEQFENGYWYAVEIKAFSNEIGIPSAARLRKDELEKLIKHFLRTGEVKNPSRKTLTKPRVRDIDKGLNKGTSDKRVGRVEAVRHSQELSSLEVLSPTEDPEVV